MKMWSMTLKVSPGGGVELTGLSDGIPPGEYEVRGHDDGNRVTLITRQRDTSGRFVISAYHRRDRGEEALEQAEEVAEAVTGTGGEAAVTVSGTGEIPA